MAVILMTCVGVSRVGLIQQMAPVRDTKAGRTTTLTSQVGDKN